MSDSIDLAEILKGEPLEFVIRAREKVDKLIYTDLLGSHGSLIDILSTCSTLLSCMSSLVQSIHCQAASLQGSVQLGILIELLTRVNHIFTEEIIAIQGGK